LLLNLLAAVSPESSEAAAPGEGLLGVVSKSPLSSLAHAFEEGRNQGRQERPDSSSSSKPSLKALADRWRNALGGRRNADEAEAEAEAEAGEEEYVEEVGGVPAECAQ
jgi:hypothetical protein